MHKSEARVRLAMNADQEATKLGGGLLGWLWEASLVGPTSVSTQSEVQAAALGVGEVNIFQTHPVCSRSLQHAQS